MKETFVYLFAGDFGTGKTVALVSYHPKGNPKPKRLVVDKEFRAVRYQAEAHGLDHDDPANLLYTFQTWPPREGEDMTLADWASLVKLVKSPERPDVIGFDNFAAFQDDITVWCDNAAGMTQFLSAVGRDGVHASFLKSRFKQDQYWRKAQQDGIREFILICKRNGVDVIVATTLQNKWANYGAKGYDAAGNPMQKILGQTAKAWDCVLQMADTCWRFTRSQEVLLAKPQVSIDPMRPKNSIVGLPPKFTFEDWDTIWGYEAKRVVPTTAQMAEVVVPPPTSEAPFEQGPEGDQGGDEPPAAPPSPAEMEAKKKTVLAEAIKLGYVGQDGNADFKMMSAVLKPKNLWPFKAGQEDAILSALQAGAPNGKVATAA